MRARIYVTLKTGIHDPQGRAIHQSLITLGFQTVEDVRMGKLLEVDLKETDPGKAKALVDAMCQKLLANPVIEDFRYDLNGQ